MKGDRPPLMVERHLYRFYKAGNWHSLRAYFFLLGQGSRSTGTLGLGGLAGMAGPCGEPQGQSLRTGKPQVDWLGCIVAVPVLSVTSSF